MRRFVTLAVLLFSTISFGVSLSGCKAVSAPDFCNGSDSGPVVGQVTTLTLQPRLTGISINVGQIGQVSSPAATDCKGGSATVSSYTFGTTDLTLADVNPVNGQLCAGSWNRNSGAGIADYTTCNPTGRIGTAYVTASAGGVSSNPIAIYVHPIVTSIVLGAPSTNCQTDPASNCALDATQTNGCSTSPIVLSTAPNYLGNTCVSQGALAQLAARVYTGTSGQTTANNISCLVGPLSFSPQNTAVVTVNQAGVATAVQPGTTVINANNSQSSSSAGLFSTCPPASIALTVGATGATSASINQNASQNLTATVLDTNGVQINNLSLAYVSTTPTTIQTSGFNITPTYPGSASITAICQPPSCNPSPFNQINLFGTGLPVVSNSVAITSPGHNSTVIYIGSTNSQYVVPVDFTTNTLGSPVRMPFPPNSMVIADNSSAIYMGTPTEIMIFSPVSNAVTKEDNSIQGIALSVSPDSNTVVVTDPVRQLTYLYAAAGGVQTEIGGVATHAQWSPDSSTVYITTSSNEILVHSTLLGWSTLTPSATDNSPATSVDVAVTVPSQGAYFAGPTTTARTICPVSTVSGANGAQVVTNTFYPLADTKAVVTDRITATNNGKHVLGASATTGKFDDIVLTIPASACPTSGTQTFTSAPLAPVSLGVAASSITGVLATSDSNFGFITYTGTGGTLPQYNVTTSTLTDLPLLTVGGTAPVAPVAGAISADDQTLYLGTSGDNLVHILTRGASGFTDTSTLAPALPALSGSGVATPNLIVQRPRKTTS